MSTANMTVEGHMDQEKVSSRAEALPEETRRTAADDPQAQAEQILAESEERTLDSATVDLTDDAVERRKTDDLVPDEHLRPDLGAEPA